MFFKELFGPKWKSDKPEVRTAAVAGLHVDHDRTVLRSLACEDPEASVRLAALRRLSDVGLYRERVAQDDDATIQAFLAEQCGRFLCGQSQSELTLAERLQWLSEADALLVEKVAREGRELELRQAALARVTRESLLADVAIHDPHIDLRLSALARVQKKSVLERIWKESRTRDKRIAKEAKARLDALSGDERKPEVLAAEWRRLCEALEALSIENDAGKLAVQLEALDGQWQTLCSQIDEAARKRLPEDLAGRAERALAKARRVSEQASEKAAQAERWAQARRDREALCHAVECLLDELRAQDSAASADAMLVRSLLDTQLSNWQHGQPLPAPEMQAFDERFRAAMSACERALAELPRYGAAVATRESLLARLHVLEGQQEQEQPDHELLQAQFQALAREWRALPGFRELSLPDSLTVEFERLDAVLGERIRAQREAVAAAVGHARKQLGRLESLLRAGRTRAVAAQLNTVEAALAELDEREAAPLRKRLEETAARLNELQDWRVWAALPRKQALCEELESLLQTPLPPRELGQRLRAAQALWRTLGSTDPEQDAQLAARFEAALAQAYVPVKAFQAEQKAQRDATVAAREALCAELETLAGTLADPSPDWKQLEADYAALRTRWQSAGPLPATLWAELNGRFRKAGKRLESGLRAEQAQNSELKAALVAEAEKLAAMDDLRTAAEQLKQLQQRWKTIGRGLSRQDAEHWQRFRGYCDSVFGARQEQFDARRAAEKDALELRSTLCDELDTVVDGELQPETDTLVAALEQRWLDAPDCGRAGAALEKRWHQAHRRLAERKAAVQREKADARFMALSERAALCAEQELKGEDGRQAREMRWAELPTSGDPLEAVLAERWAHALDDTPAVRAQAAELACQTRTELALRLEILAGVDSPAELADARMRMQVTRLSERLREGGQGAAAERLELLRAWYSAGPTSPQQTELEARFHRALAAMAKA